MSHVKEFLKILLDRFIVSFTNVSGEDEHYMPTWQTLDERVEALESETLKEVCFFSAF